jgi:hypothetical protein
MQHNHTPNSMLEYHLHKYDQKKWWDCSPLWKSSHCFLLYIHMPALKLSCILARFCNCFHSMSLCTNNAKKEHTRKWFDFEDVCDTEIWQDQPSQHAKHANPLSTAMTIVNWKLKLAMWDFAFFLVAIHPILHDKLIVSQWKKWKKPESKGKNGSTMPWARRQLTGSFMVSQL